MTRPNPIEYGEIADPDDVDEVQHLQCRYRSTVCLSIAAMSGWTGFTCSSCGAYTPMDELIWRSEVERLAGFGLLVARLAAMPDEAVTRQLERPVEVEAPCL